MLVDKKYLGAFKKGHRKNARWCIDDEFASDLLKKAKDGCKEAESALLYLSKFNNEYHKGVIKKGDRSALHFEDDLRKECYSRVNTRNRDFFSKERVYSQETYEGVYLSEEDIIDCIDRQLEFERALDAS